MPNVSRGDRMHGLTSYLVGPGRANEHTEPHLVAGDEALMAWHDDAELSAESAASIARHLDRPQRAYDVEVTGGHVWHCSLSLRAEEGAIGDEKWGEIARDFLSAMEFDDAEGTKAPMRWAAFHHGTSKAGNDHIHLVVNLVREDGTKASVHNDFRRAQKAARVLEQKHGLEQLESDGKYATRGYKAGEREVQARGRARARYERTATPESTPWDRLPKADREARVGVELRADHSRQSLARGVRAAATASGSEADFVRRVRQAGMLVRPRYADGRTDVITGFSVAERPQFGERPTWYGGYRLGNDLSLSRLRQNWPDTPQHATDAAGEWNAARRQRRVVGSVEGPTPDVLAKQGAQLEQMVDRLNRVPFSDRDTWSSVARDTAGAFAAWSRATESTPGDLAQISDALSRAAQTYRPTAPRRSTATEPLATTAMTMMAIARGGRGRPHRQP